MKHTPRRWVRDLAPITLATDREIRIQLVEVNGRRRVAMAMYAKGDKEWVRVPGCVEIPIGLITELQNRLNASIC